MFRSVMCILAAATTVAAVPVSAVPVSADKVSVVFYSECI